MVATAPLTDTVVAGATVSTTLDTTTVLSALTKREYPEYEVEDFKAGDLNADGRADLLVVLRGIQPCNTLDEPTYCRKALLVLNEGFSHLRVAATNDDVVDCTKCGGAGVGDPYRGIVIKGTYFSFESLYGACDKTYYVTTFHYDRARRNWISAQPRSNRLFLPGYHRHR